MLAAVMLLPMASHAQDSWTVADGTTTHAKVPLDFYNTDGTGVRNAQMLYPASLLTDMNGSTIGSITFYHQNTTATKTVNASTWYILMGETTETDLSTGFSTTALDTVYAGILQVTNGVFSFEFNTPYTYNGGNLLVEIYTTGATGNYFGSSNQDCYGVDSIGSTYSSMSTPNYTAFLPKTTFTEVPSCFGVTNLAIDATQTTSSSLTLTWTDTRNTNATYTIYDVNGDDILAENVSGTSYTVSNLSANTIYTLGVAANCGAGDEAEMVTVLGRTSCAGTTGLPYSENFSGYDGLPSYPYYGPAVTPSCWGYYSNGTNTAATTGSDSYYGGVGSYSYTSSYACLEANNPYLCIPIQLTGSAVTSTTYIGYGTQRGNVKYAVLPAFDTDLSGLQISFDYKMSSSYSATGVAATLELGYVTTDTASFVSLQQYQAVSSVQQVSELSLATLAADAPAGARLAFKFSGVHNGTGSYSYSTVYCGIDNILVEVLPNCVRVSDLAIAAIGSNTVTLTWVDSVNSGATYTAYAVSATDTIEESGIYDTTYTLTGLNADMEYTFGVVANCSASDASSMATVSGRTACAPETLPYSENFDDWTSKSPCWSFLSGAYNMGTGTPTAYTSAWTLNSTYGSHITISGKALTMNVFSTTRYWAVSPLIEVTSDDILLSVDVAVAAWSNATPNYDADDTLAVAISTDGGTTFTNLAVYGSTQLNSMTGAYSTILIPVSGYADSTVRFAIFAGSSASGGDNRIVIDNISVSESTGEICYPVSSLMATNITSTGATLTWEGTTGSYNVYAYGTDTTLVATITDTFYVIDELLPNTDYTYGVSANCTSSESVVSMANFRTTCGAETLPFSEDFAASLSSDPCWRGASIVYTDSVQVSMGANNNWTYVSSVSNGIEAGHYRVNIYGSSCYKWLITPTIDFTTASSPLLTFDAVFTKYSGTGAATGFESNTSQKFLVLVSTNDGTTWSQAADISLSAIAGEAYATQYVDLSAYAGENVRIAFYAQSTTSGGDNNLHLDNINVSESTGEICYSTTGLTVSNITATSATVTWNSSTVGNYVLYIMNDSSSYMYTDTVADLYTLQPNTEYTVGVTVDCPSGESPMITTTFHTVCMAIDLPYTETFDATSGSRTCWSLECSNTNNIGGSNGAGFVTVSGREVMRFSSYSNSTDYNQYGFSPMMNVSSSATNLQVTVVYATYGSNDQLNFGYVTATDTVWDPTTYTTTGSSDWQTQTFIVPATATQLAAHYYGSFSYYAWIDSFVVTEMTGDYCAPVTGLTVDSVSSSSISLSWTSTGTDFTVVNMADGTVAATTTDTYVTISGLTASTAYTFGVVNNCPTVSSDTVTIAAATQCENMCTLTVDAVDGYGDGWTGSYIDFVQNGVSVAQFSMADQMEEEMEIYETAQVNVCSGSALTLNWVSMSSFDYEASFTILNASGDTLFTADSCNNLATPFYTVADPCAGASVEVDSVYVVGAAHGVFAHGTVTPMMSNVAVGESITFTATPDSHYVVEKWIASYMDTNNAAAGFVTFDSVMGVPTYTYTALATHVDGVVSVMAYFVSDGTIEEDSLVIVTAVNNASMGTINPAPGTHVYHAGDYFMVEAIPNEGYHVESWHYTWTYEGEVLYDTTLNLGITQIFPYDTAEYYLGWTMSYTVNFAEGSAPELNDSLFTLVTAVNDATMGTITPAPGTHTYDVGETYNVTATANEGYYLYAYQVNMYVPTLGEILNETIVLDELAADEQAELQEILNYTVEEEMLGAAISITAVFARLGGINDVEADNFTVSATEGTVVVLGAEGQQVTLFDVNGRMMSREANAGERVEFRVSNSGVYLVKVGNAAAKRVVVIR